MDTPTTVEILRAYKIEENSAFTLLFKDTNWKNWSVRRRIQQAKIFLPFLGPKKKFRDLLSATIKYRKKIRRFFKYAPVERKSGHDYIIQQYELLLSSLPGTLQPEGPVTEKKDFESGDTKWSFYSTQEEDKGYRDDHDLFFDVIEGYTTTINELWESARKGTSSVLAITTVTNCMIQEMRSLVHAKDLLPDIDSIWKSSHPVLSELRMANEALDKVHESTHKEGMYIRQQIEWCLSIPMILCPPICHQIAEDLLEPSTRSRLSAQIGVHLLLKLQWTTELQPLKAATENRLGYLEILLKKNGHLLQEPGAWHDVFVKIKPRIADCNFPWLLGNIITMVEANILQVFERILEEPLLPTYIHVYQHLRLKDIIPTDNNIESMCGTFERLIFWNGIPTNEQDVESSFSNWVMHERGLGIAKKLAKLRYEENIAFRIGSLGYRITRDIKKQFELPDGDFSDIRFLDTLVGKLEETRNRIDTFALAEELEIRLQGFPGYHSIIDFWKLKDRQDVRTMFPLEISRLVDHVGKFG